MAAALLLLATTAAAHLLDVTRRDNGDTFTISGESCGPSRCAEYGAGAWQSEGECACACPQRAPLFREDRELCVDDLPECSLATFGTGAGVQKIPFVFLPLKGQIIHPSKEITFQDVKTPICAVSGAQFMTRKGFVDLRNTLDADVPFSLFRDEGRTFLQWTGEDEVRLRVAGHVLVVRLLCRDVAAPGGAFSPCAAFRLQGTPIRQNNNVTEVLFVPNAHTSSASAPTGLTVSEYVAIGISSVLLGLIYVASVFLYLHIRKLRKNASEEEAPKRLKGIKKKDGSSITEHDIVRINNERVQTINPMTEDDGVIKKNPLLSIGRQFQEIRSSFPSDEGSAVSDSDDFADGITRADDGRYKNQTVSAVIHPHNRNVKLREDDTMEPSHRDESSIERLPDEHVSIVETTDDREIPRPVGTTRRKLYFNPAYFEPQLMAEPPAAALEFLVKIREVISIAKHKMAAKRFQPVLNEIPEEETFPSNGNSIDIYQGLGSQRSGSVVSLKRENSRKKSINCVGCPGCKSDESNSVPSFFKFDIPSCPNCVHNKGEKQKSIRQWLENVPTTLKQHPNYNDFIINSNQNNGLVNSLLSLPMCDNKGKIRKQNSFSATNHLHSSDTFYIPKKSSTLSVKSEPVIRSYNIPLPDFGNEQCTGNKFHGRTISRINDIRPIGFNDMKDLNRRQTSLRCNRLMTNKNVLPDMVNEAIALEHCSESYNHSSSDEDKFYDIKKINTLTNGLVRKKSCSPAIVDYETDSLERMSHKRGISTPTEYADVPSSQASPSLSAALPLDEELTMRNAVYKSSKSNTPSPFKEISKNLNHYEIVDDKPLLKEVDNAEKTDYSLVSEVYVNNNYNFGSTPTSPSNSECSMGSRKLDPNRTLVDEKTGCLTIEVKDSPENYIKVHESDDFEPDTLDRKISKMKEKQENSNTYFSRKELIKSLSNNESPHQTIQLRSSGTFKKPVNSAKFSSLRHVYEQGKQIFERPVISTDTFIKSKCELDEPKEDWETEEGRILTLEIRHSKRQRQSTPPTIKQMKNLARPDVLPPLPPTEDTPIYEQPAFPPRPVDADGTSMDHQKNLSGRSLSPRTFMNNIAIDQVTNPKLTLRIINVGSPCSPTRASVRTNNSGYENINQTSYGETSKRNEICRNSSRRRPSRSQNGINTNTFVKPKDEVTKSRYRRKRGVVVDDSGYLSSDSACSRQVQRRIVIPKTVSCSDSDDTENEARSESGAESVETHSVFFGSFRQLQNNNNISNNFDRSKRDFRNSSRKYILNK